MNGDEAAKSFISGKNATIDQPSPVQTDHLN